MKVFIISTMLVAAAMAAPGIIDNKVETDSSSNKMIQYFSSCFDADDTTNCLAVKGIAALNRASRASNIQVGAGLVLTKDPSYTRSGKALSENEIVASLPTDAEERSSRLYDMAAESVNEFLKSHSLQLKFPDDVAQSVSRAIDEGRKGKGKKKLKKLKKLIGPLLLGLGSKIFALLPLFLVGLAFLAFKALIVSKIALVLAGVLAISKMMSGGGGLGGLGSGLGILGKVAGLSAGASGLLGGLGGLSGGSGGSGAGYAGGATGATGAGYANAGSYANSGSTGGGWSSGGNSAYPYARSYDEDTHDAQDLAYNAHAQNE